MIVKKIANFIVKNRYLVLVIMIIITGICAALSGSVTVNTDMTTYLPDKSSMKQGMEIMDEEFPEAETDNTIRIMFKNLPHEEKVQIQDELSAVLYVKSVDYDDESENYNKLVEGMEYSLFVVNTTYNYKSHEEIAIEEAIIDKYTDSHDMVYSTDDDNKEQLSVQIVALALLILMVILFLMCGSWIEPFLLLLTIVIAIVINMGTNIFLPSVSSTTKSISSILQMVLSMDYSIILINRYRQEKLKCDDKFEAMKGALTNAFTAITSSSVTTIVGLLALVFMSFKIGADMGIVLAKGVFISLICIFTVLPVLILMLDQLIQKTSKKVLNIKLDKLGCFGYKFRYVIVGIFAILFAVFFLMKGNTQIAYTLSDPNEIDAVFPIDNRMVLIYENKDDNKVMELAKQLESDEYVTSISAYTNTLGEEYTVDELANMMRSMSSDSELVINLDESIIKMLYYNYFTGEESGKITFSEFINFLQTDVINNSVFGDKVDSKITDQINQLVMFTSKEEITKERTSEELSAITSIDMTSLNQLIIYYDTLMGTSVDYSNLTISIDKLIDFIVNELLSNPEFSGMFDETSIEQLQMMQGIIYSVLNEIEYSSEDMADFFGAMSEGIGKNTMELMYLYYFSTIDFNSDWKISIYDFINYLAGDIINDEQFLDFFDEDIKEKLSEAKNEIQNSMALLKGEDYSRMIISTTYPDEAEETTAFLDYLSSYCDENLSGNNYIIGNTPMAYEMSKTFHKEFNFITILTAIFIFIVVAIAFRSLIIPLILVLIIQGGVYATVLIIGLQGYSIYYLALLIVQSILMGATIDYGILFTIYYRENRISMEIKESLIASYNGSIHTILTSGLIMVVVTGILGRTFSNPTVGQICETISKGALCAIVLIIFILPGILAAFDRFICKNNRI